MTQESKGDALRFRISIISILLLILSILYMFVFNGESKPTKIVAQKPEPKIVEPAPIVEEPKKSEPAQVVESKPEPVKIKEEVVVEKPIVETKPEIVVVPIVEKAKEEPAVIVVVPQETKVEIEAPVKPIYVTEVAVELLDVTPAPIAAAKPEVVVEKPDYRYAYTTHFWFNGKLYFQKVLSAVDLQQFSATQKPEFSEYLSWLAFVGLNANEKTVAKFLFETDYPSEFQVNHCNCDQHKHQVTLADECALVNVCLVSYQSRNELKPMAKANMLRNLRIALSGLRYIQSDTQLQKWLSEINSEIIQLETK